jgi:hypothetical protein
MYAETGCDVMDSTDVVQQNDVLAPVNMVTKFQVPQNGGNF